jgi:hypothetical protein
MPLPEQHPRNDQNAHHGAHRRNLSPVDFKLALGRRYNRTKQSVGGQLSKGVDQNEPPVSTAAKLATQHGVSEATVKRAGKLAEAVEAHPEIKEAIASGMSIKDAITPRKQRHAPPCQGNPYPILLPRALVSEGKKHASPFENHFTFTVNHLNDEPN